MYKSIIIDTNLLYYRNFATNKKLTHTVSGQPMYTGGIYGSIKSIMALRRKYLSPNGEMVFLFDNHASKSNLRKQIDETYKCNRIEKSKKFYKGIDYLEKILMYMYDNCKIVRISYMEADDLLPAVINCYKPTDKILLVSNDEDWCRSLTSNIHILKNKEIVTQYSYEEKNGFFPTKENIILYKTFKGDTSDNIPNPIPRFPKDKLIQIMDSKIEDIWDFLQRFDKGEYKEIIIEDSVWYKRLKNTEIRKRLILNWRLVDYMGYDEADLHEGTFNCKFKKHTLRTLYLALGFNIEKLDYRLNVKMTNFFT